MFGSVARGEDHPGSDVDLLADFPPGLSLFGLGRLEADLEGILGSRMAIPPPSRAILGSAMAGPSRGLLPPVMIPSAS